VQPEYPGGVAKLSEFVRANLKYPIEAAKKNIQGRVVVEFIILADGKMDDIKVTKSVDRLLDAEAIRIVKAMSKSKWTPGKLNGEPVAVRFILPVSFSLK
jgi:TonB family protein